LQHIAETRFNRNNKLAKTGAVSQDQFDESQSVYERSKLDVIEREAELELGLLGSRTDEINAAEATVKAKQADLELANWKLSEKKLFSSVEGYVQDTLFRVGEWVPAGRPVVSLLPPSNVKVRFFVPENKLAKIQLDQTINIVCDSCDAPIPATINYVSSEAEFTPPVIYSRESREKLVYMIEAKIAPEKAKLLHPGQPIEIHLNTL
jgi:HlyD family secretion protein